MFAALVRRHRLQQEREDYRAGVVAATIANSFSMVIRAFTGSKEKFTPVTAENFFVLPLTGKRSSKQGQSNQESQPESDKQPWQQQLEMIKAINAALKGAVIEKPKESKK
jgi:hypothetical protein